MGEATSNHLKVAIKTVVQGNTEYLEREFAVLMELSHPNIVRVYDCFEFDGKLHFAMELVRGSSLGTFLERHAGRCDGDVASVFLQLMDALDYLHEKKIIHAELQPGNILVTESNELRLIDFEHCHRLDKSEPALVPPGTVMGTPKYMSPEHVLGTQLQPESDHFVVGLLLLEHLHGQHPLAGASVGGMLHALAMLDHKTVAVWLRDIDEPLKAALEQLLAPSPDHRRSGWERLRAYLSSSSRHSSSMASHNTSVPRPGVEREVVGAEVKASHPKRVSTRKHIILFLAAKPIGADRFALDREARAIHMELERSGYRDHFEFETRWAVEPLDLLRELRKLKPAVVHFSGRRDRSVGDGDRAEQPDGLCFQGSDDRAQVVSTAAIAETFGAAGASVQLVVLIACYTDAQAEALLAHVDCVVGVGSGITDEAARSFVIGFYGGLAEREPVAVAYRQGRAAISLEGLTDGERPRLMIRTGVDANRLVLAIDPP